MLLTGDAKAIGEAAGRKLQVDEVEAELLPEKKQKRLRDLRASGRSVAVVGDGIHDAPALMEANAGMAMGSGTDVAWVSANVLLLGNDLLKVVEVIGIARRATESSWRIFAGHWSWMGRVLLAALGYLNPVLAALIHVGAELFFILNSARLIATQPGRRPAVCVAFRTGGL